MNDEQDSGPKSQASDSEAVSSQPPDTNTPDNEGFNSRRSAAEIAGETVAVVGEATGQFQRPPSVERDERESTTKSAFRGRSKIAQRFIAGIGRNRDEVREADG